MVDILIKNMVCPRCIESVESIFKELEIPVSTVELGQVKAQEAPSAEQISQLKNRLFEKGFELLESRESKLIAQIKNVIIDRIHYQQEALKVNFSTLLAQKLLHDYSYLSRLFSSVEGQTIEQFIIFQKVEKVKELLSYEEMSTAQIAELLNYSSAAYLSSQFKRVTGLSPSEFRQLKSKNRKFLDEL